MAGAGIIWKHLYLHVWWLVLAVGWDLSCAVSRNTYMCPSHLGSLRLSHNVAAGFQE